MQDLKKLINKYANDYPELEYFNVQFTVLDATRTNYPDVVIETCKSIMEATYKFIRKILTDYQPSKKEERQTNITDHANEVMKLFKESSSNQLVDVDVIQQSHNFTKKIANIRNNNGDISHGRYMPKETNSTAEQAQAIEGLCETYAVYLIEEAIISKFGNRKKHAQQQDDNIQPLPNPLEYESPYFEQFNEWLNSENEIDSINYSKALYEQDYNAYYQKYADWYDENDLDNLGEINFESMLDMDYEV